MGRTHTLDMDVGRWAASRADLGGGLVSSGCSVVRGTSPRGFEVLPVSQGFWFLFLCLSLPRVR